MNIKIDPALLKAFPHTKIGILIAEHSNNSGQGNVDVLLRAVEQKVRAEYTLEHISSLPKIADWREAYRAFGCKPSEYRCSVESLLRRVLQHKNIPSISPVVDIYNTLSLTYLLPAGGGNLDVIDGDIVLTFAQGNERFIMLGDTQLTSLKKGEVVYKDESKVLCRAWNYRESDETKITPSTQNMYFIFEGLEHTSMQELEHALLELKELISRYCGGNIKTALMHAQHPTASLL